MKNDPANGELITVKEVMRRLSIGRSTVYRLAAEGAISSVSIRGARRFHVGSVDALASGGDQ